MKTTTRQKIIAFLRKSQTATAAEVARTLRITPADARHHLSQLTTEGLVENNSLLKIAQPGRPVKIYRLTGVSFGDNSALLLDLLLENMDEKSRLISLRQISAKLAGDFESAQQTSITRRLANTVEVLGRLSYQPRWEAHASGPQIILGHCPFSAIVAKHPELCEMDSNILSNLLGEDVEQIAKLERNERGTAHCLFAIKNI